MAKKEVQGVCAEGVWVKLVNMSKPIKPIIKNNNSSLEGKAFGCSEIFTLDNKGKVIKKEWKCEEIKDWKW